MSTPDTSTRSRRASRAVAAVVLAAAVAVLPVSTALASTGPTDGTQRAAAVQGVLDRVLGPGNSVVVVSDTIRTSTSAVTSVQYGSGVAGAVASDTTVVAGEGATTTTASRDLVGATTTSTVTPPGALVRQSVSVAVDRAHLGGVRLAAIRRIVSAAVGLAPSRGDRLSVVVATFPKAVPAARVTPPPFAIPAPLVAPALWTGGAIVALAILGAAIGGRRSGRVAQG